jgi:hypothetical protein
MIASIAAVGQVLIAAVFPRLASRCIFESNFWALASLSFGHQTRAAQIRIGLTIVVWDEINLGLKPQVLPNSLLHAQNAFLELLELNFDGIFTPFREISPRLRTEQL